MWGLTCGFVNLKYNDLRFTLIFLYISLYINAYINPYILVKIIDDVGDWNAESSCKTNAVPCVWNSFAGNITPKRVGGDPGSSAYHG